MKPKVSIIIPVFNVSEYLNECLDSIVSQTLREIEIIVVNDGSTDNSKQICETYKLSDDRINLINKENGGLSSARNAGIRLALGEYIGFVDSDDFIKKNMFERLYHEASTNDADVAACNCYAYYKKNETVRIEEAWVDPYITNKVYSRLCDRKKLLIPCLAWLKIYRKSFINKFGIAFPEGIVFEDNPWNMAMVTFSNKIVTIDEPLYYYRMRPGSIMNSLNENSRLNRKIFDILEVIRIELDFLRQHPVENDQWNAICKNYIIDLGCHHYKRAFDQNKKTFFYHLAKLFKEIKPSKTLFMRSNKLNFLKYSLIRQNWFLLFNIFEKGIYFLKKFLGIISSLISGV